MAKTRCCEVLLAQIVIAGKRIFRMRGRALERQIDNVANARSCGRLERISMQLRTFHRLAGRRHYECDVHPCKSSVQCRRLGEIAMNDAYVPQLGSSLRGAGHQAQKISLRRQQFSGPPPYTSRRTGYQDRFHMKSRASDYQRDAATTRVTLPACFRSITVEGSLASASDAPA